MRILLVFLYVIGFYVMPVHVYAGEGDFRIAFGSCNKAGLPQPIWKAISAKQPDLFIWTGDNVYANDRDMAHLKEQYDIQKNAEEYANFREKVQVIGTWDDHDYGLNDGGKHFEYKEASQEHFLEFIGADADDPRRGREGIYTSYVFGDEGRRVKVILLDTRYHRDEPGDESDLLGKEQWAWLRKELSGSGAEVHIIVSSIQVVSSEHKWEKWQNFPAAKQRLFRLIEELNVPGVVIVSGDRHFAEISKCGNCIGYPLYDITSSGMTHSWSTLEQESNHYRVGNMFTGLNYGLITVNWNHEPDQILLEIFDKDNIRQIAQKVDVHQLLP